jgi:hypothetical protein
MAACTFHAVALRNGTWTTVHTDAAEDLEHGPGCIAVDSFERAHSVARTLNIAHRLPGADAYAAHHLPRLVDVVGAC